MENGWMYCVYRNHAAALIRPFYFFMPPTSKKLTRHIGFRLCVRASVHVSIHSSRTLHARILKFHTWIPHGKIVDVLFFFLSELSPFLELCSFEKI